MGQRGPAPSPAKLRLLHGAHPNRIPKSEPVPGPGEPVPPPWLTPDARAVWDRTVRELGAMGMAHAADTDALTVYCTAVVNFARAQQLLDQSNIIIKGVEGGPVRNPAMTAVNAAAAIVSRFARDFGLTPSARTSIGAGRDIEDARTMAGRLLS